jgi:hypothetical protein
MPKVFLSYNRESEAAATVLVKDCEALGHTVWLDHELTGGQKWWDQILVRIRECDVFVLLLTPRSLGSTACQREYRYAIELAKPILPVLVSDGLSTNLLPPELASLQFVDYKEADRAAAFRLAKALASLPPPGPLPDPLPLPPAVPVSYLSDLGQRVDTSEVVSHDDQSALIVQLRQSLRDPDTADDGRVLLQRLRKRRDLFAGIADEIDGLLEMPTGSPAAAATTGDAHPRTSLARSHAVGWTERVLHVALWGLVGVVLAFVANGFAQGHTITFGAGIPSTLGCPIAFAVSGLLVGRNRRSGILAVAGLVLGFLIAYFSRTYDESFYLNIATALAFGCSGGALVGSTAGAIAALLRTREH